MDERVRIMIVDDNPRARHGLCAFLSANQEWKVVCEASDGEDALAKIESQSPSLVLMDVQMPVMDGLTATRIIKERWPHIKIIVLTLYADYRSQVQEAGADGFLVKGCSVDDLRSAIYNLS